MYENARPKSGEIFSWLRTSNFPLPLATRDGDRFISNSWLPDTPANHRPEGRLSILGRDKTNGEGGGDREGKNLRVFFRVEEGRIRRKDRAGELRA